MNEKITLKKWDVTEHLETDRDRVLYLNACLEEDPGDGSLVRAALNDIARAKGMSQLARDTDMTRKGLYKALPPDGNPGFDTLLKVTRALGLALHFEQQAS